MKGCFRLFLLSCLLIPILIMRAGATELSDLQKSSIDVSTLEDAAPDMLEGISSLDITNLSQVLDRLREDTTERLTGMVRAGVRSASMLLLIVLICSLADIFAKLGEGLSQKAVCLSGAGGVALVALSDMDSLIGLGRDTIERLSAFTTILMPTMTTVAVASGSAASAPVRQAATLLCSNLLTGLVESVLLPMTWAYAAGCVASAALGSAKLKPLCDLLRWIIKSVLTTALVLYTGYLAVAGTVACAADATTMKAASMVISGMIPVVGSILSDATGAVLSGASLLRNSIGIFGLLGVIGFCLIPFLRLGVQFLLYKLVAALSATLSNHPVSRLIQDLSSVFALVMGMTGACALVVLLSIISVISTVVPT